VRSPTWRAELSHITPRRLSFKQARGTSFGTTRSGGTRASSGDYPTVRGSSSGGAGVGQRADMVAAMALHVVGRCTLPLLTHS
jgi:hypothetical protein